MIATQTGQTRGRSKASQERGWSNINKRVEDFIRNRPEDGLATLLAHTRELNITRSEPNTFYQTRELVSGFADNLFSRQKMTAKSPLFYPMVAEGEYTFGTISVPAYIMKFVRPSTTAIVELGSGWGANLFQLYVGLGYTACRGIDFHGAEFTDMGQKAANRIASYDGRINFHSHSFNYRKPDISFLEGYSGHILIFTRHSIEQVDKIAHQLYQMIYDLNVNVTLMHFEPVGWQRKQYLREARESNDVDFFTKIGENIDERTTSVEHQVENAAWWSWRLSYNKNLLSIINRYTNSEQVKVVRRAYDFDGIGNVFNPTTLMHLEFTKRRAEAEAS
ncbi:MAG: hypothetical protein ACU0CI_04145 [Shimia sp.]